MNERGVSLAALIVTIVIIIILATIGGFYSVNIFKKTERMGAETELRNVEELVSAQRAKVKADIIEIPDTYVATDSELEAYATSGLVTGAKLEEMKEVNNDENIPAKYKYHLMDQAAFDDVFGTDINVKNVVRQYLVNFDDGIVVSNTDGVVKTVKVVKAENPIAVTTPQRWETAFSTSAQTKAIVEATNAQGAVTYGISSQKEGNKAVNYFTLSGTTLTMAANTPAGTYTTVIRATAAGNDEYNSEYKMITMTVTVGKAEGSIAYETAQVPKTYGDAIFTNTLTKIGDGAVTYSSSNTNVATVNASTGAVTLRGTGSSTITATVVDSANYTYAVKTATYELVVGKASNPIAVTEQQSWSAAFSNNAQTKTIEAATGGQGTVTYTINSQEQGTTNVTYFTINGTTLTMAPGTPVGTYTVVIRVAAAGNDNYNADYRDITMTVMVGKAENSIAATTPQTWEATFSTSAQDKAFTTATSAQGAVTYAINSQKQGSTNVTYFSIPTNSTASLRMAANTPSGTYTVVIRATAAGNDNYNSGYKDITMTVTVSKAANPIAVTATQSWAPTFSTSAQTKAVTAATGGQGTVTYAIQSQKQGTTAVTYFTLSGTTLTMKASTPVGTYTVVIRATAAGNDNYNSGTKDITMTVTVGKAANPMTVTATQSWGPTFSTSAQTKAVTAATGGQGTVTYAINSQKKGSTAVTYFTLSSTTLTMKASTPVGTYTVVIRATAAGNDNYNSGYKDITMTVTVGKAANPIAVTATQSWSTTFKTSSQDKIFTAATGGQGTVTYAVNSQKKGSTTVSYFSIPTNTTATLRLAASAPSGTYTVVIRATAAGNANYNSGYKDITMTVTVADTKLAQVVKVGDYVRYVATSATYTPDPKKTGSTLNTTQTTDTTTTWRVWENDGTTVKLIPTNPVNTLYLGITKLSNVSEDDISKAASAFSNAPTIINEMCNKLYSKASYTTNVRSINIDDIKAKLKAPPTFTRTNYAYHLLSDSYTSGTVTKNGVTYTKTWTHNATPYTGIAESRFYVWDTGAEITYESNQYKTDSYGTRYIVPTIGHPVYVTNTSSTNIGLTDADWKEVSESNVDYVKTYGSILGTTSGLLPSQLVITNEPDICCDLLRVSGKGIFRVAVLDSIGFLYGGYDYSLRPLVTLNSTVQIDASTAGKNGSSEANAWVIK